MSKQKPPLRPVLRVAPPGELNAFVVYEYQLDILAQGSPASLMLNYSLFFLGVAATSLGTLFSLPESNDRAYVTFLVLFLVTLIAGVVLLGLWWSSHKSIQSLVIEIKSQMPPNDESSSEPPGGSSPPNQPTPRVT